MKLKTVALIVGGLLVLSIGFSVILKLTNNDAEVENPTYSQKDTSNSNGADDFNSWESDLSFVPLTQLFE